MANIYVRSTDGNNSDNGSTWALAKATLAGAAAIDAAGDTIFVSQNHSENGAATISLEGTRSNPVRVICANDAAEPPTSVADTGVIEGTGNISINTAPFVPGSAYVYGLTFRAGVGSSSNNTITLGGSNLSLPIIFERCNFELEATGASGGIGLFGTSEAITICKNCGVKFANAGQAINASLRGQFIWQGGSVLSGGTSPSSLMKLSQFTLNILVEGVDLTNCSSSINLIDASGLRIVGRIIFRNCKLPSSWSGSFVANSSEMSARCAMYNCDSADTNYRLWIMDYTGSILSETTLVRTGGASDGATPLSWKLTSTANAKQYAPLKTDEIVAWNETVGSAITVTVDILHDSATALKDNEVWLDVQYLGTSGVPLGSFASDGVDVLAAGSDQDSSSATWTTTGMSNPNTQKLSVTFTPQEKGVISATVHLAKASYTVYVDPVLQIS